MNIEFLESKDGNRTCRINSLYFHSVYSPIKESERFASNLTVPFNPEILFLIEPGYSYAVPFLRAKYPKTKIAVIRLCETFKETDKLFDYVYYLSSFSSANNLCSFIFNSFGENITAFSFIAAWEPAAKIFQNETISIFKSYKNIIEKSHTLLRTRSFFEKRWLLNSIKFCTRIQNLVSIRKKGSCPCIICASGPSLKDSIPYLKNTKAFIIAVSSALEPLSENGIIPDIVISTDGGFWAAKHIQKIPSDSILALAVEGNAYGRIFKNNSILPLVYEDGLGSEIFKKTNYPFTPAVRCGTVSGTALFLAKEITTGPVYFCGLDLYPGTGFQHTQGNILEFENASYDKKSKPSETRNSTGGFSNQKKSLKIYEDWFSEQKNNSPNSLFRVINAPKNHLTYIKDIKTSDLENLNDKGDYPELSYHSPSKNEEFVKSALNIFNTPEIIYNAVFPADFLNYVHSFDENQKENLREKLESQCESLRQKVCSLFTKN